MLTGGHPISSRPYLHCFRRLFLLSFTASERALAVPGVHEGGHRPTGVCIRVVLALSVR